jgi:hypothetical protein
MSISSFFDGLMCTITFNLRNYRLKKRQLALFLMVSFLLSINIEYWGHLKQ